MKDAASKKITTRDKNNNVVSKYYTGRNITIDGGTPELTEYADTITNTGANVSIAAGDGNDLITNSGSNVTAGGGAGNDTINNAAVYQYTSGNDVLTAYVEGDTIQLLNDTLASVSINGSDAIVSAGSGSILLKDAASKKITTRDKNGNVVSKYYTGRNISNSTASTTPELTEYADTITNTGANVSIEAGSGADSIRTGGSNAYVDGGAGNDFIDNEGWRVTLLGGGGNDKIKNSGANVSIDGGNGTDSIVNIGAGVTIDGGDGNDTIDLGNGGNNVFKISDGNDVLSNLNANDMINLGGNTIAGWAFGTGNNGNDVILTIGENRLTLKNARSKRVNYGNGTSEVYGSANIENAADNITLKTNDGTDTITNTYELSGNSVKSGGANVFIDAGTGNDLLINHGENVTIDAGSGNDTIRNTHTTANLSATLNATLRADKASIYGGVGNDYIENDAKKVTVRGGTGNDTIVGTGAGMMIEYADGDGNDVITNYNSADTINIVSGTISKATTGSGTNAPDVILTVGDGSITIKDARSKKLNIIAGGTLMSTIPSPICTSTSKANATVTTGAYDDSITNSGKSANISSGAGNDTIINAAKGSLSAIDAGEGNDYISNEGNRVTLEGGAGKDKIENSGASVSVDAGDGADSISNSGNRVTLLGGASADTILNTGDRVSIYSGAGNDSISDAGVNTTIYGGKGNDTINRSNAENGALYLYAYSHGDDVLMNFSEYDTISLTSGTVTSTVTKGADIIVTVKSGTTAGTLTLKNLAGSRLRVEGKCLGIDTLPPPIINTTNNILVSGTSLGEEIRNSGKGVTIYGGRGDDSITGTTKYGEMYLFGAKDGNDLITNFDAADTISVTGGETFQNHYAVGNDYLINLGGGGRITLKGAGSNLFRQDGLMLTVSDDTVNYVCNDSNSVTVSGSTAADNIVNAGEHVTVIGSEGADTLTGSDENGELYLFSSADDSNVITNFGKNDTLAATSGTLKAYKAAGDDVLVTIAGSKTTTTVRLIAAADYIFKKSGNTLTVSDPYIYSRTANKKVSGTQNADWIVNYADGVTIASGAGNDTLEGSNFGEMYQFSSTDGKNVILDFGANDTLNVSSGTLSAVRKVGDDAIVSIKGSSKTAVVTLCGAAKYSPVSSGAYLSVDGGINYVNNADDDVTVKGGNGKDWITNAGVNVTIVPGKGNDTIEGSNYGDLYAFAYNGGNNIITNFDANDTLAATSGTLTYKKSGNDVIVSIKKSSTTSKITLVGAGDYFFTQSGGILSVDTVKTIGNDESGVRVTGTGGKDYIENTGANVTIRPNGGNDTIIASDEFGEVFEFAPTSGENLISTFGRNDTLKATSGTISAVSIVGNNAIATIYNAKSSSVVTLAGAGGYDFIQTGSVLHVDYVNTIENDAGSSVIGGTNKRDYIINNGERVTIAGSKGNDTIEGSSNAEVYTFAYSHGNNLITGFDKNDSLVMTSGKTMTYSTVGNDVIVTMTKSSTSATVTLEGAASLMNDLTKTGSTLWADYVNSIENNNGGERVTGTARRDYIETNGDHVTVVGSAGSDTIEGSTYAEVFAFGKNTGANVITNFGVEDTLAATSGGIKSLKKSGKNYVVSLSGGTVTLQGTSGYKFLQNGSTLTVDYVSTLDNYDDNTTLVGTDGRDLLINDGQNVTIKPNGGNDTIESSEVYGEMFLIGGGDGSNVITNFGVNDTLKAAANETITFSTVKSDVVVTLKGTTYTGTVTLKDAAGMSLKSAAGYLYDDSVKHKINRKDSTAFSGSSSADWMENTGANVTINAKGGNDTIVGSANGELFQFAASGGRDVIMNFGANDTLAITSGNIEAAVRSGDDYVVNVKSSKYSGAVTLKGAGHYIFEQEGNTLTVKDVNYVVNRDDGVRVTTKSGADYVCNSGANATIVGSKGNDTFEGSNQAELYQFAYNHNSNVITNFGLDDTLVATSGTLSGSQSGSDYIVTITKGKTKSTVRLADTSKYVFNADGNTLTTEHINYISETDSGIKITGKSGKDWIESTGEHVTIQPGKGNDTVTGSDQFGDVYQFAYNSGSNVITNFGVNDTLMATSGTLSVKKSGSNAVVTIKKSSTSSKITLQGAGAYDFINSNNTLTVDYITTLDSGDDDKLLTGTDGRDIITNSGENVTIQSGGGNDTLSGSVFAETYLFGATDGNNVITDFGLGDTLKMTSEGTLSYKKSGNNVIVTMKGTSATGKVTLLGAAALDLTKSGNTLYAYIPYVVKENHENGVKFNGSSGADLMTNYGSGVTISPGKGNDTLTGSAEYGDVFAFAYSSGNNVITNFSAGDTLKSTSGTIATLKSGDDYVVSITKSNKTARVTLEGAAASGTLQASKDGKSLILRSNSSIELQLPGSAEDYWFTEDETIADAQTLDEILAPDEGVDLNCDEVSELLKQSQAELTYTARKDRSKK